MSLTPIIGTHICNGCYLTPVVTNPELATAKPVTNEDFW
jgi:hypothetical protein